MIRLFLCFNLFHFLLTPSSLPRLLEFLEFLQTSTRKARNEYLTLGSFHIYVFHDDRVCAVVTCGSVYPFKSWFPGIPWDCVRLAFDTPTLGIVDPLNDCHRLEKFWEKLKMSSLGGEIREKWRSPAPQSSPSADFHPYTESKWRWKLVLERYQVSCINFQQADCFRLVAWSQMWAFGHILRSQSEWRTIQNGSSFDLSNNFFDHEKQTFDKIITIALLQPKTRDTDDNKAALRFLRFARVA